MKAEGTFENDLPSVHEDEEIYCPVCTYNLTGIFSGRCPECGSLFDRNALIAAQRTEQIALIPWDDPKPMPLLTRLFKTLQICLFNTQRFAFAFSVQPRKSKAISFFLGVTAAVTLINVLSALIYAIWMSQSGRPSAGGFFISIAVAIFVPSTLILTTVLSSLLLTVICPHYDGRRHFRPWLNIAAYASSHYLLTFPTLLLAIAVALTNDTIAEPALLLMAFCLWPACALLCAFTMRAIIGLRASSWRIVGTFLLFVIHGGITVLCIIISFEVVAHVAKLLKM